MMPGLLFNNDWDNLKKSIDLCLETFPTEHFIFVEVGIADGRTSFAIGEYLRSRQIKFDYYGVDLAPGAVDNFPEFQLVQGCSYEMAHQVPQSHWIFIDACHCEDCVEKDALAYCERIKKGGFICFHDANTSCQGTYPQHNGKGIGVQNALKRANLEDRDFSLVIKATEPPSEGPISDLGGLMAYQKNKPKDKPEKERGL